MSERLWREAEHAGQAGSVQGRTSARALGFNQDRPDTGVCQVTTPTQKGLRRAR